MSQFSINPANLKANVTNFTMVEKVLKECQTTIYDVSNNLAIQSSAIQILKGKVRECGNQVGANASAAKTMGLSLEHIVLKYGETEDKILNNGGQIVSSIASVSTTVQNSLFTINTSQPLIELEKKLAEGSIDEKTYRALMLAMGLDQDTRDAIDDVLKRNVDMDTLGTLVEKLGADSDAVSIAKDIAKKKVNIDTIVKFLKGIGVKVDNDHINAIKNWWEMVWNREGIAGKMIDDYYSGPYIKYEEKMQKGDYFGAFVEYSKGLIIIPTGVSQVLSQTYIDKAKDRITSVTKKIDKLIPNEIFPDVSKNIGSWFDKVKKDIWKPKASETFGSAQVAGGGSGGGGGSSWGPPSASSEPIAGGGSGGGGGSSWGAPSVDSEPIFGGYSGGGGGSW